MSFETLPPEVLLEIGLYLSRQDLTRCVRVSKAWHHALVDLIWHAVEINDHASSHSAFYSFMAAYSPLSWYQPEVILGKEGRRDQEEQGTEHKTAQSLSAESLLQRNIYRIRLLDVHYSKVLDLFYQPPTPSFADNHMENKEKNKGHPQGDLTAAANPTPLPPLLQLKEVKVGLARDPPLMARYFEPPPVPASPPRLRPPCSTQGWPFSSPSLPGFCPPLQGSFPPGLRVRPLPPGYLSPPPGFSPGYYLVPSPGFPPSGFLPGYYLAAPPGFPLPTVFRPFAPQGLPDHRPAGVFPPYCFPKPPAIPAAGMRPLTASPVRSSPTTHLQLLEHPSSPVPATVPIATLSPIPSPTSATFSSIPGTQSPYSTRLDHPSVTAPPTTDTKGLSVIAAVHDAAGVVTGPAMPLISAKPSTASTVERPFILKSNFSLVDSFDIRPLLQILDRSRKNLRRLTISMANLAFRGNIKDQVRVLVAALESCEALEELTIWGFMSGGQGWSFRRPSLWNIDDDDWESALEMIAQLLVATSGSGPGLGPTLKTGTVLSQLRTISIVGPRSDIKILQAILVHQKGQGRIHSLLEEFNLHIMNALYDEEETFSSFIRECAGPKGWKTLGIQSCAETLGPLTVASVLAHAPTLENLRLVNCPAFSSEHIQALLSTAPRLKRFDALPTFGLRSQRMEHFYLMATDILRTEWVCQELRSFKCMIGGIPKPHYGRWPRFPQLPPGYGHTLLPTVPLFPLPLFPDLDGQGTGQPEDDWPCANWIPGWRTLESDQDKSRAIERLILERQFGRLRNLVELSFGMDNYDNGKEFYAPEDRDSEYDLAFPDSQFQGLAVDLASGLEFLKALKRLQRIRLTRKGRSTMGAEEMQWIREHWPAFFLDTVLVHNVEKHKDRFWTDRGFEMSQQTRAHYEELLSDSNVPDEGMGKYFDYDWW